MTRRPSMEMRSHIKDLATAYHSFCENIHDWGNTDEEGRAKHDNGIIVWGDILAEKQKLLGVEMFDAFFLQDVIANAKQRDDERRKAVA